ncbi:MAG: DUF1292 domain-containing protein [Firmicutes bacterium]|nr:DUF1292 domain-containing protein [Bacillota bacterium]
MADEKELYGYEEEDIITLEYDDGVEEECGVVGVFDVDGKDYIALNPLGTGEVYIYGYKEYEEDFELIDDLTDEEFAKATAEFESLIEEDLVAPEQ